MAGTLGTCVLVLTIITNCDSPRPSSEPLLGAPYSSLAVPLAGELALGSMVAAFGPVSEAHLNPALTLGLVLNRRFPWAYVVVAQKVAQNGRTVIDR